jgi:dGTPase
MAERMNWQALLCPKRVSDYTQCNSKPKISQLTDPRSPFERDFDQLMFSYPFRRLQDKTQVIPFPKFDFVHTRLTHSLEVASVGRSFGKMAAEIVLKELPKQFISETNICKSDIGALVAAACLAHDIGNPPFGHSGEDAISYYFLEKDMNFAPGLHSEAGKYFRSCWNSDERVWENIEINPTKEQIDKIKRWSDLAHFEGNANGFRIITRNCDRGINPTVALLGTFTKYPRESFLHQDPYINFEKEEKPKSHLKHGFFQEQRDMFLFVANELGLIKVAGIADLDIAYHRHPLAFLMEASDDIAYGMIDFEDGCRLGLIDFEKTYGKVKLRRKDNSLEEIEVNNSAKNILVAIAENDNSFDLDRLNSFTDFKQAISYLRGKVINVLIHQCFAVFVREYENIMTGKFDKALIDCISNSDIKRNLDLMSCLVRKFIYQYAPVLESEASGFEVMEHLIGSLAITSNICYSCGDIETAKDKKLRSLLPEEFQPEIEKEIKNLTDSEKYSRVLTVLDYIAGMTDKFAISLYRRILGIQIEG